MIREERPDAIMRSLYHAMIVGQFAAWRAGLRHSRVLERQAVARRRQIAECKHSDSPGLVATYFEPARRHHLQLCTRPRPAPAIRLSQLQLRRDSERLRFRSVRAGQWVGYRLSSALQAGCTPRKITEPSSLLQLEVLRTHASARFVAAGAGLTPDNEAVRQMIAAAGLPFDAIELRGNTSDMDRFYQ